MRDASSDYFVEVLKQIYLRSEGDFEKMTLAEKMLVWEMMKELYQKIEEFMQNDYLAIKAWAELSFTDLILSETRADLDRLHKLTK